MQLLMANFGLMERRHLEDCFLHTGQCARNESAFSVTDKLDLGLIVPGDGVRDHRLAEGHRLGNAIAETLSDAGGVKNDIAGHLAYGELVRIGGGG